MLCQECGERKAKVHVTKIINGEKKELYLCQECAQESGELDFSAEFSFDNLLTGLLNNKFTPEHKFNLSETDVKCEACGLSYSQFSRNGRLGCNHCYKSFGDKLDKILRKIHSSTRHTGKIPQRVGKNVKTKRKIKELNRAMEKAVEKEEFERAAKLRDEIKELRNKLSKGEE